MNGGMWSKSKVIVVFLVFNNCVDNDVVYQKEEGWKVIRWLEKIKNVSGMLSFNFLLNIFEERGIYLSLEFQEEMKSRNIDLGIFDI